MSEYVTDEMIEKAAKELYEFWVSRDNETRMFAPTWDNLESSKSRWLRDARTALETAAPAIAAQALRDAADKVEGLYFGPDQHTPFTRGSAMLWGAKQAAKWVRERADQIEAGD